MSDRDPKLPHRGRPDGNRNNYQSNATKNQLTNGHIVGEVSYLPHSNESLVHKVNALATELESLHTNFEDLKTLYNTLYSSVEYLKKGAWNVTVGPFLDQEAAEFKKNLDLLTAEARSIGFGYDGANSNECQGLSPSVVSHPQLSNSNASTTERRFIPPHLRNSVGNGSVQFRPIDWSGAELPSSNNSNTNDRLVNDSQVDKISTKLPMAAVAEPTPPSSPMTTVYRDNVPASVKPITNNITLDTKAWQPYYLTTLPSLESSITAHIPELHTMESFSPDFLGNELGGSEWSPGLTLILGWKPSCPLRTAHCYYTVDAVNDPFLPSTPGTHGAKLVPFFNDSIENEHPAPTGCYDSNENVPMFVLLPDARRNDSLRYFYFGNYSQTRWSDKLDYDRMVQCVPQHVREYWANELSVNVRTFIRSICSHHMIYFLRR
jgi:hypothetical protein